MFAYPVASPEVSQVNEGLAYQVAYLRATFPRQSKSSPYRLVVMDRDGSNENVLFPPAGEPGLEPQQVIWSPSPLTASGAHAIALLHQGNLWLVNARTGEAWQITGDGLTRKISWR